MNYFICTCNIIMLSRLKEILGDVYEDVEDIENRPNHEKYEKYDMFHNGKYNDRYHMFHKRHYKNYQNDLKDSDMDLLNVKTNIEKKSKDLAIIGNSNILTPQQYKNLLIGFNHDSKVNFKNITSINTPYKYDLKITDVKMADFIIILEDISFELDTKCKVFHFQKNEIQFLMDNPWWPITTFLLSQNTKHSNNCNCIDCHRNNEDKNIKSMESMESIKHIESIDSIFI
jgi:hypothetical protein